MAVINSYEAVIVISLKLGEEGIAETIAKFKDMVSKNGTLCLLYTSPSPRD